MKFYSEDLMILTEVFSGFCPDPYPGSSADGDDALFSDLRTDGAGDDRTGFMKDNFSPGSVSDRRFVNDAFFFQPDILRATIPEPKRHDTSSQFFIACAGHLTGVLQTVFL